jgi:serine/threonine protein kinase
MDTISDSYAMRHYEYSKPPLPYNNGSHLSLRSHQPPAPTTFECRVDPKSGHERQTMSPLDRCLIHPPLPGKDGQDTAKLVITQTIRAGDAHCAQVVAVRVKSSSSGNLPRDTDLVAKIYDPLYFDHDQDDADPFRCIDHDYSHEAAAYEALSSLQGLIIPKYYGSFSIEIKTPASANSFRTVRLILVEFIPGRSMRELKPKNLARPYRQAIMKAVIDAESLIYTHNVLHKDIRPANVIICDSTQKRDVVIIDFGKCVLGRHDLPQYHKEHLPGVSISPLLRWHKPKGEFRPWIDWNWAAWLDHVYEPTRASITDHMRSLWGPQPETFIEPPPLKELVWGW